MAVALGNVRGRQAALFARHLLALAGTGDPFAFAVDHPNQPDSIADCADAHVDSSVAQTGWKRAGGLSCPDCGKGRDSPAPCRFWEKNARGSKRNGRPNVTFSSYFGSRIDFPTIHGLHLGPDWLGNLGGARVPEEFGSFWSQDQCDCQSICCNNDCGS